MKPEIKEFLQKPLTGNVLAVCAGLAFLYTCMMLTLVGRAGVSVPHSGANRIAFLSMLLFTLALSVVAAYSKLQRRVVDQSPYPYWTAGLSAVCILLLILQLTGLLAL